MKKLLIIIFLFCIKYAFAQNYLTLLLEGKTLHCIKVVDTEIESNIKTSFTQNTPFLFMWQFKQRRKLLATDGYREHPKNGTYNYLPSVKTLTINMNNGSPQIYQITYYSKPFITFQKGKYVTYYALIE